MGIKSQSTNNISGCVPEASFKAEAQLSVSPTTCMFKSFSISRNAERAPGWLSAKNTRVIGYRVQPNHFTIIGCLGEITLHQLGEIRNGT